MSRWLPRLSLHLHCCLIAVMAFLLAMQSATGAGVMPARAADGGLTLTVCSAAGMAPATVRIDLGNDKPARQKDSSCPHAMMEGGLPTLAAPKFAQAMLPPMPPVPPFHAALGLGTASPLPPATGPPILI